MPSKDRRTGPDKDTTALRARPYPGHPGSLPNRKVGWPRSAGLGSAAAWPVVARAQQGDRMRRIGVLMAYDENDPLAKAFVSAFIQAPADLGWTDGRNVQIDIRWHGDDNNRIRALAQELIGLQPDIILTYATPATVTVQRETRTIPIVFVNVAEPIASGIVARLDRLRQDDRASQELAARLSGLDAARR